MGKMIEEGKVLDVPSSQRLEKAVQFYEKSARKGNTEAMTDLGFLNEKGILGHDNNGLRIAIDHYKMAIEADNPRAMNNLAGIFLSGRTDQGTLKRASRAKASEKHSNCMKKRVQWATRRPSPTWASAT